MQQLKAKKQWHPSPCSPSRSAQLDHGGHGAVAEGVGGAAAVWEELPGLPGHGQHLTSVSTHLIFFSCKMLFLLQNNLLCISIRRPRKRNAAPSHLRAPPLWVLHFADQPESDSFLRSQIKNKRETLLSCPFMANIRGLNVSSLPLIRMLLFCFAAGDQ